MSDARQALARAAREAADRGLNRGTSGNLSVRAGDGMLITPSAVPPDELRPEAMVRLAVDGSRPPAGAGEDAGSGRPGGPGRGGQAPPPSTEWRLHAAIYGARPEAGAVLHAHPPYATALACLRREIPAFHYLVAVAGGDSIPCAPYATFGTPELAEAVVETLEGRRACLMANHGLAALAASLPAVVELAAQVEWLAQVYWRALGAGDPAVLPGDELDRIRQRLAFYRPEAR